jgi:hypothetical protein
MVKEALLSYGVGQVSALLFMTAHSGRYLATIGVTNKYGDGNPLTEADESW